MTSKKILCICDYGQVRSGAMAWYIHGLNREDGRIRELQYEAIAIGAVTSSKQTMKYMKKWADLVIDVRKWLPSDTFGCPTNDELMDKVKEIWWEVHEQLNEVSGNGE